MQSVFGHVLASEFFNSHRRLHSSLRRPSLETLRALLAPRARAGSHLSQNRGRGRGREHFAVCIYLPQARFDGVEGRDGKTATLLSPSNFGIG